MKEILEIPVPTEQNKNLGNYKESFFNNENISEQLSYWQNKLNGFERLILHTDYTRTTNIEYKTKEFTFELDKNMSVQLNNLAKNQGVNLDTLLFSVFNILLSKYSNEEDITLGLFYTNKLILRNNIKATKAFDELLVDIEKNLKEVYSHQNIPFDLIVDHLNIDKNQNHHPIFSHLYLFQNSNICDINGDLSNNKYDFSLSFSDDGTILKGIFTYDSSIYKNSSIKTMADRYVQILKQIINNPKMSIKDISLLNNKEYEELIHINNQTQNEYLQTTIPEQFEKQVKLNPNNIALVYEDKNLTYKELDELSNQMARYIKTKIDVKADTLIALCVDRSLEMIISILGILKAGGAYVPIDANYPDDRIKYILEDTNTSLVLSQSHLKDKLKKISSIALIEVDKDEYKKQDNSKIDFISSPRDLAYVIYTSGTTGKPKGVMVEHDGIVNLVDDNNFVKISAEDCFVHLSSPVFDAATFEIWGALLNSAKLVLPKDNKQLVSDTEIFKEFLLKHKVSILWLTKTLYDLLYLKDNTLFNSINYLLSGGEALSADLIKQNISNENRAKHIINGYGPTETVTFATTYNCDIEFKDSVPIGKALSNKKLYILDKNLKPVAKGITGELYVSGVGVARGYLNKDDLTKERFLDNPFANKEDEKNGYTKMYKTGDLVRLLEDNNIEYIGRSDFQVKIRGYRIELGEIESVINKYENIKQAVVLAKEKNGFKYLVAYYTNEKKIDEEFLIEYISKELPSYMMPTSFVNVDEFKLTVNGKLDTKVLPEPELRGEEYEAPSSELEIKICDVFKEVLNVERLGIKDDFFKLGGNSILAISLAHKLSNALDLEIKVADIFSYKNVSELIEHGLNHETIHIPMVEQDKYPLSFAQQRLYFIEQYEGGSNTYNIPISIKLNKNIDLEIFKKAMKSVVDRHEILKTLIKEDDELNLYQELSKEELRFIELAFQDEDSLKNKFKEDVNKIFDLHEELPIYVGMYQFKEEIYVSINIHHIAFDGWSMDIFFKEISEYYYHYKEQKTLELDQLTMRYKDFAIWQREYLSGDKIEQQFDYWKEKLDGVETLELPSDYERPNKIDHDGEDLFFEIDEEMTSKLRVLAQDQGVTLYTLLLSAFNILLSKYSNAEDIVVGSPIANRHYKQIENLVGFFVNALAIRNRVDSKDIFSNLLKDVNKTIIEAQTNQDIPFESLVNRLKIPRDTSRQPLFDILFGFQSFGNSEGTGLFSDYEIDSYKVAKYDLSLFFADEDGIIKGVLNYAKALFKSSSIKTMATRYKKILEQIVQNPNISIKDIKLINEKEYTELIYTNNGSQKEYNKNTICELFIKQAKETPNNIALAYEDKTLSYKELDALSNQMARYIQSKIGIKADTLIALCLDRSLEMIISILGVLKAGGAYVPIDPSYPDDRIKYIIEDTNTKLVLSQKHMEAKIKSFVDKKVDILLVDKDEYKSQDNSALNSISKENDLAYVIYTSGTTGKPKGVMIEHNNVNRLFQSTKNLYNFNDKDTWMLFHSFVFDFSVWEIWGALLYGGKLFIPTKKELLDTPYLFELMDKHGVSVFNQTPSAFYNFISVAKNKNRLLSSLRYVIFGGEALNPVQIKPWYEIYDENKPKLINMYGITETTVHTTYKTIQQNKISERSNIGNKLSDLKTYILDENLNPVPKGITGELYISGAGLARGYLNKEELTKERFIPNPFVNEDDKINGYTRMYKTGDLVRVLEKNNLEYIGRSDFQVKIRGYRIELGEIESVI